MGFHYLDYIIFFLFLVISLSIGLYHAFRGGKQKTTEEFLMGNRKFSTFPVAISITLSFISAIVVIGLPAEVYTRGTQFIMVTAGHVVGFIFSIVFVVPVFFNLHVTSSFEYLEMRYNSEFVKLMGSFIMLFSTMIQLGVVLYAPAVALEAVTGIPTWSSIILSSLVAIIYTTLGGMKAVIWTDVFQGLCLLAGMCAVVVKGTLIAGGFSEVWQKNQANERLEFFNINPDPTIRTTFWSALVNGTFVSLAYFAIGQTTVQRYCALPTLGKANRALFINTCLLSLIVLLGASVGMVIYAYYDLLGCDPIRAKFITSANQIFPYFIMDVLNYPGIPGLFISVLYGGALSTMSSSLNSAAAVTWQDLLRKYFKHLQDSKRALVTKILVVVYGASAISMAFLAKYLGGHVLQAANSVSGTFTGPVLGMFILGMFFKFANAKGALIGCTSGIIITMWLAISGLIVNPHKESLPTSIEKCFHNKTTPISASTILPGNASNFINFLPQEEMPVSTSNSSDMTKLVKNEGSKISITLNQNEHNPLYAISYLYYPFIGFVVTMASGSLMSLATGGSNQNFVDGKLLARGNLLTNCFPQNIDETNLKAKRQLELHIIKEKEQKSNCHSSES